LLPKVPFSGCVATVGSSKEAIRIVEVDMDVAHGENQVIGFGRIPRAYGCPSLSPHHRHDLYYALSTSSIVPLLAGLLRKILLRFPFPVLSVHFSLLGFPILVGIYAGPLHYRQSDFAAHVHDCSDMGSVKTFPVDYQLDYLHTCTAKRAP
jgi:hypothetical protein